MQTTWSRPTPLSRGAAARIADLLAQALMAVAHASLRQWRKWQASRRHALEMKALRQLSPSVLRDIGAPAEWILESERWCSHEAAVRSTLLRTF